VSASLNGVCGSDVDQFRADAGTVTDYSRLYSDTNLLLLTATMNDM